MKKNQVVYFLSVFFIVLFSGCTSTFMGTVLVLSFKDIILYIALAFIIAVLASIIASGDGKKIFWIWFILNLILTPLAGFIYLLVLFTKKS